MEHVAKKRRQSPVRVCPKHKRSWKDSEQIQEPISVCDYNAENKLYLIEWSDRTRTWETSEKVKSLKIEALMPSYIS
jgi:hypothetical protein